MATVSTGLSDTLEDIRKFFNETSKNTLNSVKNDIHNALDDVNDTLSDAKEEIVTEAKTISTSAKTTIASAKNEVEKIGDNVNNFIDKQKEEFDKVEKLLQIVLIALSFLIVVGIIALIASKIIQNRKQKKQNAILQQIANNMQNNGAGLNINNYLASDEFMSLYE